MYGAWLLCDFHIHTNFSDGKLQLKKVVDLYGEKGFDAIAITDHILDSSTEQKFIEKNNEVPAVLKQQFNDYMDALWKAAQSAWKNYNMLVIPGIEITNDSQKFHLLGIDIKEYINPDLSVEKIVKQIHRQGGIAIACHPHHRSHTIEQESRYLWHNHEKFAHIFDAWEVANRDDLFNVIGLKKFNYIANSDFHEKRHLYSWKTLLLCEKNPEAIKQTIRMNRGVSIYLYRKNKDQ